jgi:pimeloyl-ACP methyl ester carboxylesterase
MREFRHQPVAARAVRRPPYWLPPTVVGTAQGERHEHDPALGEETVRQTWLPLYPQARLEVAANAGHYPMFEAPANLATLVERFLAEAGQRQGSSEATTGR